MPAACTTEAMAAGRASAVCCEPDPRPNCRGGGSPAAVVPARRHQNFRDRRRGGGARVARCLARHLSRRVRGHHGPIGVGQDHLDESAWLPRYADRWRLHFCGPGRGESRPRRAGVAPAQRFRLRVPELQSDRHGNGDGERRNPSHLRRPVARGAPCPCESAAFVARPRRSVEPSAEPVIRWTAAARVHRARVDEWRPGYPCRRTDRCLGFAKRRRRDGAPQRSRRARPYRHLDHPRPPCRGACAADRRIARRPDRLRLRS